MIPDKSIRDNAGQYLELFADDASMRASLLACSAALSLDDDIASEAIRVVLPHPEQTQELLGKIKRLGCVSQGWDGSWRISEDVRVGLASRLSYEFPEDCLIEIRMRLASKAEHHANSFSPDGQITNYRVREARFQAAYQKLLTPGRIEEGAQQCAEIWRRASVDAREATCSAADYVSDEVQRQNKGLPAELLFLKGMAARMRGDRDSARDYFFQVWKQGRPGDIYAIAAHLFGNLSKDRELAERSYRDSVKWYPEPFHQGQVWHSLGNLMSRQSQRWKEAEEAYRKSLQLLHDPADQGQVWHSLGNLMSRQSQRWKEAEEAYRKSLQLRHDPADQGQVWHSLGNLMSRQSQRWKEAEEAYRKSLQLRHDPAHQGQVWHSLGNLLSRQSQRWKEAEEAYRKSLQLRHDPADQGQVGHSLGNLLSRQSQRWKEAEEAYRKSLQLLHDPAHQGQVWHSLGNLLSRQSQRWKEAEEAYRKSLQLLHDPADQGQVWHSLGNLMSRQSQRWKEAEEAYRKSLKLLHDPADQGQVWHSLGNLMSRQSQRWKEAEEAYRKSLQLRHDPATHVQVYASWARAIVANRRLAEYGEAEEYAKRSLEFGSGNLRTQSTVNAILAELYEAKGQYSKAAAALMLAIEANKKQKNWKLVQQGQQHLEELRRKI